MKITQKQKKTATLVGMFGLLALVLGMGGQTYAKYISNETVQATGATVAKWGLIVDTVDEDKIWGAKYAVDSGTTAKVTQNNTGLVVNATSDKKIVAPGTSGAMSITVDGVSEVKAKITIVVDFTKQIHHGTYYPFSWTVGTEEFKNIEATDVTKTYEVTPSSDDFTQIVFPISWEWALTGQGQNDTLDTELGNMAKAGAAESGSSIDVEFSVTVTMEQVQ